MWQTRRAIYSSEWPIKRRRSRKRSSRAALQVREQPLDRVVLVQILDFLNEIDDVVGLRRLGVESLIGHRLIYQMFHLAILTPAR
jgi:hypothetical protein